MPRTRCEKQKRKWDDREQCFLLTTIISDGSRVMHSQPRLPPSCLPKLQSKHEYMRCKFNRETNWVHYTAYKVYCHADSVLILTLSRQSSTNDHIVIFSRSVQMRPKMCSAKIMHTHLCLTKNTLKDEGFYKTPTQESSYFQCSTLF